MSKVKSSQGTLNYVGISDLTLVADASREAVIAEASIAYKDCVSTGKAQILTAIHIGGLNALSTPGFSAALRRARMVYADGIAVVLLAKLAGAKSIERSATTDIGIPVIRSVAALLQRPVRLALLGGEDGLASSAADSLRSQVGADVVYTNHGYRAEDDWHTVLEDLREAVPDIVILGLGSPQELLFADRNLDLLPPSLILTCGGWFGFLAGEEPRAHWLLRRLGLEWLGRLWHSPRRLGGRYVHGVFIFLRMAIRILGNKIGK